MVLGFDKPTWQIFPFQESPMFGLGDFEEHGITLVCLCPSVVKTEMTKSFQEAEKQGVQSVIQGLQMVGGWVR